MIKEIESSISVYSGPLYKYKSLADGYDSHSLEILRDHVIYCPTPSEFADELDCRPDISIGDLNEPGYRQSIEAWVRKCLQCQKIPADENQIQVALRMLTPEYLKQMAQETTEQYQAAINSQYRILCMATSYQNTYLWNCYASHYSGVCIELDLSRLVPAYRVEYVDKLPVLDIAVGDALEVLKTTVLRKRLIYSQEREARIILKEPPIPEGPKVLNSRLCFGPARLKSVTFGYRADVEKKQQLISSLEGRNIPIFVAKGGPEFTSFQRCFVQHS